VARQGRPLAKVPLTIGTRDERSGRWQVLTGLQAGDMVVRVPASGFKDGQKVALSAPKAVASASAARSQKNNQEPQPCSYRILVSSGPSPRSC
jgi:fructose-1-phosphate kinase PfkB-like protein